jgi:glutathione S-transferase
VKLSQTFAILKYLGRKHNLVAKTEEEQIRVDLIEAEAIDMRIRWSTLCYNADFVSTI